MKLIPNTGADQMIDLAQKGKLPAFKDHGQLRFKRADLDQWIEGQKVTLRNGEPK